MGCSSPAIQCTGVNSNVHCDHGGICCEIAKKLEEMTPSNDVLIFGVIVGIIALLLTAFVVYIVVRIMRRRNVQVVIIEDDGELCSPLITDADIAENDGMDSVVIVRNHSVRSHMRYSTASYCCNPSHSRESGQFALSPVPSVHPCQYTKQTSAFHAPHTVLHPHVEEEEEEEESEEIYKSKPIDETTKL